MDSKTNEPIIVSLREVHLSALVGAWPATECVEALVSPSFVHRNGRDACLQLRGMRAGPWPQCARALLISPRPPPTPSAHPFSRSALEFGERLGGSIGAALRAGTADLASCKLSFCCVAAGVDLSHDVHAKGVHGDEKLRSKEGAVFLATPDEWKAALQARLGAPHHVKDARHALGRAGVLIADGKLSLLGLHERHGLEAFKDAWLFELPQ